MAPNCAGDDNECIKELPYKGFDWEIEDDFAKQFGFGIDEFENGTHHMLQKGFINKVMEISKILPN